MTIEDFFYVQLNGFDIIPQITNATFCSKEDRRQNQNFSYNISKPNLV